MKRVGIDIGGTFTDFFFWDDETRSMTTLKVPSTPEDPSIAGAEGLQQLCRQAGIKAEEIGLLLHGTTVATNIVVQHKGARVGLITTRGFRDILHIGRKNRPLNFSNYQSLSRQSRPIVKRRHRLAVAERISAAGDILQPLEVEEVRTAVRTLKAQGVEAIAVCGLFAFVNPAHELAIKAIIDAEFPGAYVTMSHEVVPLYREYERFSTTALNAYVGPQTATYLQNFATRLEAAGFSAELHLMSSSGGAVSSERARQNPVSLLLSGPVGALVAGIEVGREIGCPSVITLDVGGTSADIGVAPRGELRMKHLLDTRVGDYDAMVPMVDIDTIGAGGGSVAYIDQGGMFRVGPHSAGAKPGPACYGHGGERATVTDAIACLGWFRPQALRNSGLELQPQLAEAAIEEQIAGPLQLSRQQAADGIYRVITTHMVEAIRVNSVAKGYDPREFALLAFGGAGAAFAVEVGRQLHVQRVVIPRHPGVGAASGLLNTDMKYEFMATVWQDLSRVDGAALQRAYRNLSGQARDSLRSDGFADGDIQLLWKADCRYRGQGYELTVEAPAGATDADWAAAVSEAFHRAHEQLYLRRFEDKAVHLINIRVIGVGQMPRLKFATAGAGDSSPQAALVARQNAYFRRGDSVGVFDTPFYCRQRLKSGNRIHGPAIVEQADTTTVITPEATAVVDELGNLNIGFDGGAA